MTFSTRIAGAGALSLALLASLSPAVLAHQHVQRDAQCKCFPGDECWPSTDKWSSFNETLGGKLIATVPLAAVCHDSQNTHPDWPAYDEAACSALQQRWIDPSLHYPDSASTMSPPFVNASCNPFAPRSADCVVGTYVSYSIRVGGADDISAGIKFANDNNIRLIIRNTGHDFNGKSTGPGTLSLWTHNMKDIEFKDWSDKHYNGKAVKMGAGVQGFEINKAAFDKGMQVVTGSCPTVGVAGGYSQGGGHSALTSLHGMAADQVLEWEVVTAGGEHVIANRDQNTDLYWALSGGGGGTYGIVLSMTSKAHQDTPTAGANLTFTTSNLTQEAFYSLIDEFQTTVLPESTKAGVTTTFYVTNTTFSMRPMTGPGLNSTQLRAFVSPFMKKLDAAGVRYASFFGDFGSYTEFYSHMYQALPVNSYVYTGRLLPKDVVLNHGQDVVDAYRFLNEHGAIAIGIGLNANPGGQGVPDNSVNPGWREAMVSLLVVVPWSYKIPLESMQDRLEMITDELTPRLSQITPGGTTYLSEGDFRDPDWKKNFYGPNYQKLEQIKNQWDPEHIFYAPTAVGADYWQPQSDGRLCKA